MNRGTNWFGVAIGCFIMTVMCMMVGFCGLIGYAVVQNGAEYRQQLANFGNKGKVVEIFSGDEVGGTYVILENSEGQRIRASYHPSAQLPARGDVWLVDDWGILKERVKE